MTANGWLQIGLFFAAVLLVAKPMGTYLYRVYERKSTWLDRVFRPIEKLIYRVCGVDETKEMRWTEYGVAMLLFSGVSLLLLYLIQRVQLWLPWNPQKLANVAPDLAWNTAVSFTTNTNWQAYTPETTMSYLTQMAGLAYHNFVSAAVGIAVAVAVVRGVARKESKTIGNFWVDTTRGLLWVLLPICLVGALVLVSQGAVQNLKPYTNATLIEPQAWRKPTRMEDVTRDTVTTQVIAQGPTASQEAIKMLGTNGGGFFNANSAHPFENPTPLANFLELFFIFAIPSGLTYTLGKMTGSQRHGWAVWSAMAALFLAGVLVAYAAESRGNPLLAGVHTQTTDTQPGGNMEGKEVRFGIANSALFATVTTDASCGAVNNVHDSMTPLGGMIPLINIMLGEIVYRGSGRGFVRDAGVRDSGGVYRRADGGTHAGVSGEEDRIVRREDGGAGDPGDIVVDPGFHGDRGDLEIRDVEHHQSWTTRFHAGSLRLHIGGGQQRFGVRRADLEYALVQREPGRRDDAGPVLHEDSDPGDCGEPGGEKARAGIGGHLSGDRAVVHRAACFGDFDCRRTDIFPGAEPGPHPGAPVDGCGKGFLRKQ